MALNKLKVALPLGTAITATAFTAYLIISTTNDLEKNKQADEALENLELTTKPFEEEIIKAEEESEKEEKPAAEQEDLEKKSKEDDKGPKEDKKEEEETQDLAKILSNAEQDLEKLAKAAGGADQANVTLPKASKQGPNSQEDSSELGNIKEDEASSLPVNGKPQEERGEDGLEEATSSSEEEFGTPVVSKEKTKLEADSKPSLDDLQEEEQVVETREDSPEDPSLSDEPPAIESGADPSSGEPESHEEELGDQYDEQEKGQTRDTATSQEGEAGLSNKGENNGTDDEDGGAQMTEEEIEELVALQGKMAEFSDRLSNLLQLRRFK